MITAESKRKLALLGVISDSLCDGLTDTGHESWVLELSDGRVILGVKFLELVMAVKLDLPAEFCQLFRQTSLDEVDRTLVYFELGLLLQHSMSD